MTKSVSHLRPNPSIDGPLTFALVHEAAWMPAPGYPGAEYRCEHLYAKDVVHDEQRPLLPTTLSKMEKGFSVERAVRGHWIVSRRKDGQDMVIEGNHRLQCLEKYGLLDTLLHVTVYRGLSTSQEHNLWWSIIPNKKATKADETHVQAMEGIDTALAVEGPLARYKMITHNINAYGVLSDAVQEVGEDAYRMAVDTSVATWGNGNAKNHGHVIYGLALIFARYGSDVVEQKLLVKCLLKVWKTCDGTASSWNRYARANKGDVPVEDYLAYVIVQRYNVSVRLLRRKLADWTLGYAGKLKH